jgi:hypothetical protein
MKLLIATPLGVTVELTNAELAVVRNALRAYAAAHTYGAVMMDSMDVLFTLDKPSIDEEKL